MLKAISGFTASSTIKSQYLIDEQAPIFKAGAWQVQEATRKSTGQAVSVLTCAKSSLQQPLPSRSSSNGAPPIKQAIERVLQQLKAEVACLARLRHPALLEVVEPVEETRGSLLFVTERVTGCLGMQVYEDDDASFGSGSGGGRRGRGAESGRLDEVEIQKGLLQLTIGLEFLQSVAGIVHGNLVPDAVYINAKGDWKLGGFSFAVAVKEAATYEPPEQDTRLPKSVQRNLDYAAPEFILDDQIDPLNDMFSLGCLISALSSTKRQSIIQSNQSIHQYRKAIERLSVDNLSGVPPYLKQILPQLLTRRPANRLSANAFQTSPFFDNILMKSIRFLDAFPEKTASERQSFMKGLQGIIPQFPPRVLTKKILPGLMDQFKDISLLPLTLPNVFLIAEGMTPKVFSEAVLPRLKQLFTLADSPGALSFLLDKMAFLKTKTTAYELKEDVMTVVYTALAGDVQYLQEKALKVAAETLPELDSTTVKTVLFPKVAEVFTHTTMLGTKVTALETFDAMVQTNIDKYTITEKLLPLIKQMKTKEPAVSMGALKLSKSCGSRIDHENIALDLLPQLWTMSLGPLLTQTQFKQFMSTIKGLSQRVEDEQIKKLTDAGAPVGLPASQGTTQGNGWAASAGPVEEVSFEALVAGHSKPAQPSAAGLAFSSPAIVPTKAAGKGGFDWSTPSMQQANPASAAGIGAYPTIMPARSGSVTPAGVQAAGSSRPAAVSAVSSGPNYNISSTGIDWSASTKPALNTGNYGQMQQSSAASFGWSTPPVASQPPQVQGFQIAPPPSTNPSTAPSQAKKPGTGLSAYQSLL